MFRGRTRSTPEDGAKLSRSIGELLIVSVPSTHLGGISVGGVSDWTGGDGVVIGAITRVRAWRSAKCASGARLAPRRVAFAGKRFVIDFQLA